MLLVGLMIPDVEDGILTLETWIRLVVTAGIEMVTVMVVVTSCVTPFEVVR